MRAKKTNKLGNAFLLGTFSRIPVKVHWTFGLLLLFVTYTALSNGLKLWQTVGFVAYVLILFLCVVLHEFGHALTARRYGVITRDIVLSPIGGVARLEKMPDKPMHEFFISVAGPLVNLIIGTTLALILYITTDKVVPDVTDFRFDEPIEFVRYITWMNFALFFFNLIPAFPMDGGRILRSLLAARLGKLKATRIASLIGRAIAIGFVVYGIFDQQITLSLIGLFIFMMAGKEYDETLIMSIISGTKAGDIMRTSFTRLHLGDTYATVIEKYYREGEQNFLVFDSLGHISGTIPELYIRDAIKNKVLEMQVGQLMSSKTFSVSPSTKIKDIIDQMRTEGIAIVSVEEDGHILGVLDQHGIENYIRLKSV